ncbi:MAG: urea transporter, permease protein UrtC [Conexibacter sp.]|nr:urea transporter, permease protein UrtC [Conexibacter sp.]
MSAPVTALDPVRRPRAVRAVAARRVGAPVLGLALVLVFAALRGSLSRYQLDVGVTIFVYVAIAQAWNVIGGLGGQVSLGAAGFVGVGSYTCALVLAHSGASLVLAVAAAGAVAALCAAIVSVALFRLRDAYFSVGTLALSLAAQAWFANWDYAGATQGVSLPFDRVPRPDDLYLYALVVAALAVGGAWAVRHSDFGLRLMAVRDNEDAAGTLGVPAFRVKFWAFVSTSFVTGLAGAIVALQQISIEPGSAFGLSWTVNAIIMTVMGGVGTIAGPIVGVLVVYYAIQQQLEGSQEASTLITGALLVAIVRFAPQGLWGLATEVARRAVARVRS